MRRLRERLLERPARAGPRRARGRASRVATASPRRGGVRPRFKAHPSRRASTPSPGRSRSAGSASSSISRPTSACRPSAIAGCCGSAAPWTMRTGTATGWADWRPSVATPTRPTSSTSSAASPASRRRHTKPRARPFRTVTSTIHGRPAGVTLAPWPTPWTPIARSPLPLRSRRGRRDTFSPSRLRRHRLLLRSARRWNGRACGADDWQFAADAGPGGRAVAPLTAPSSVDSDVDAATPGPWRPAPSRVGPRGQALWPPRRRRRRRQRHHLVAGCR